MTYTHLLHLALPEVIVVITSAIVLVVDLLLLRNSTTKTRFTTASTLAALGCAAAIFCLVHAPQHANYLNGVFLSTPLINSVQIILLVLTIFTLLLSVNSNFTEHIGEFVLLFLLATVGMMFLVAAQDLLVLFLSLELLSLSLYILTAFSKRNPRSSEAALKYFLFGATSAAFLLYGFSLLYVLSGSTRFDAIASAIHTAPHSPLLLIAIVTTIIGLGFKVAAAPFHFWAPDAYEAAPAPAAALIASSSKVASFFIFFQIMTLAFAGAEGSAAWRHFSLGWAPVLAIVSAISMVLGSLVALRQSSVRRLIAYSAIVQAGYVLIALVTHTPQSLAAMLYYVATYALATIGIFAIIGVVETNSGNDHFDSFNGLSRRAPLLAASLFVFFLSLAGIPPLSGFFGKFYLFVAALSATSSTAALLWLVVLAFAASAVSLFYYLQVLKRAFVTDPNPESSTLRVPAFTKILVALLAAAVILLGCAPHLFLHWIQQVIAP